jgi:hypothetical protein
MEHLRQVAFMLISLTKLQKLIKILKFKYFLRFFGQVIPV